MATTKSLLEKAMLKVGARAGSPNGPSIEYEGTLSNNSGSVAFIAPSDGYVTAYATGSACNHYSNIWCRAFSLNSVYGNGEGDANSTVVAKGESVSVSFSKVASYSVKFVYSVGGGLKSFINNVVASLSGVKYGLA